MQCHGGLSLSSSRLQDDVEAHADLAMLGRFLRLDNHHKRFLRLDNHHKP